MTPNTLSNKNKGQSELSNREIWSNFKRLDLVQVAADLFQYQIDPKASYSKNNGSLQPLFRGFTQVVMFQLASYGLEVKKSNVIIVRKNNSGEYFYTNPSAPEDQGTIIDLVANRHNLNPKDRADLKKIATIISAYDGTAITQTKLPQYVPAPIIVKDRNAIVAQFHKLLGKLNRPEYLLARGLTKETIDSPELKNRIFNSVFVDKKANQYVNIAFPIVDKDDNLCGIEHKSVGYGGYQAESSRMIWRSNVVNPNEPVSAMIIGEAIIDVMSYAQMNNLLGKNVLLIAHTGNLTDEQVETIQHLINLNSPKKVILTEDRDSAGYRYDIKLMGALNRPFEKGMIISENDFRAEINITDRIKATLILNIAFQGLESGSESFEKILGEFKRFNYDDESPVYNINPEDIAFGNNSATAKIRFHVSEINMKRALDIVTEHRKIGDFIVVEKPQGANLKGDKIVDWNELLMIKSNIQKEDIPNLMFQFKNNASQVNSILKDNSFKPDQLIKLFLKNWEVGIDNAQEAAVKAGISLDAISYVVAKNQLIAFNNFVGSVQKNYELDFIDYKEFTDFRSFVETNEEKYKKIVGDLKHKAVLLESEYTVVKSKMQFDGDDISEQEFEKLKEQKTKLEDYLKQAKKRLGLFNEFSDGKIFSELQELLTAKSKKVWNKTITDNFVNNNNDTYVMIDSDKNKASLKL